VKLNGKNGTCLAAIAGAGFLMSVPAGFNGNN
jgi:hypothetical protein